MMDIGESSVLCLAHEVGDLRVRPKSFVPVRNGDRSIRLASRGFRGRAWLLREIRRRGDGAHGGTKGQWEWNEVMVVRKRVPTRSLRRATDFVTLVTLQSHMPFPGVVVVDYRASYVFEIL